MSDQQGHADSAPKMFKVAFLLPDETRRWAPGDTELLWVEKTRVRTEGTIRNVPFYVKGVAYGDTVRVSVNHSERQLEFDSIVGRSGHSTVRAIVKSEAGRVHLEAELLHCDCTWEIDSSRILWAIDVPTELDYLPLWTALTADVNSGLIEVEEAYISPKHESDLGE